jgi:hypothetical protein
VQLWGLLPGGVGFQFRCSGVRPTLSLYHPSRARWEVRVFEPGWTPETAVQCWEYRTVAADAPPPGRARLVFYDEAHPDIRVVYDGDRARGWLWCEAGRMRVAKAAVLFDRMLPAARELARRTPISVGGLRPGTPGGKS